MWHHKQARKETKEREESKDPKKRQKIVVDSLTARQVLTIKSFQRKGLNVSMFISMLGVYFVCSVNETPLRDCCCCAYP